MERKIAGIGSARLITFLLGLLSIVVILGHFGSWVHRSPGDFNAFFCGGRAVLQHADPYRVEPSLSCETKLSGDRLANVDGKVVLPAPLPGYDFIGFGALALLPPRIAAFVYCLSLLGCIALIAYCIARLTAIPVGVAVAVASVGIVYDSIDWGQIAPFGIAALALAALLLRRDRPAPAGFVLCLGLIQPQFGLPAILSAFLFVKRMRRAIVLGVVALAVGAFVAVGLRGLREYPTVLSVQSRAEVYWPAQYSLTWLLHALGSSVNVALVAGSISYALVVCASIFIVFRHRANAIANGSVILLPAAAAVLGGTFIHLYQIKVALMATVVLFGTDALGLGAAIAIGLLLMPFDLAHLPFKFSEVPTILTALGTIWSVVYFLDRNAFRSPAIRRASIATGIAAVYYALLFAVLPHGATAPPLSGLTIVHQPSALAPYEWLDYMEHYQKSFAGSIPLLLLEKAPVWIGLIILLLSASRSRIASAPFSAKRIEAQSYAASGA